MVINAPGYVKNNTIHKDMKISFVTQKLHTSQHLYFTQTLLLVTFHNTCHQTNNIDASIENATRTSSHNTRRETVTGHTPPTHGTDDCKYVKL
jgi:hypothetical protein